MQTNGREEGWKLLRARVRAYGVGTLWYGAWATAGASWVGSFPWFATVSFLGFLFGVEKADFLGGDYSIIG